jgi:hypothetical protein
MLCVTSILFRAGEARLNKPCFDSRYRNKDRIVHLHDYGVILTYQVGSSSSGPLPNWRWMDIDQIANAQMLH